eukprot:366192-Chlamydomonas_euryale.AAC.9
MAEISAWRILPPLTLLSMQPPLASRCCSVCKTPGAVVKLHMLCNSHIHARLCPCMGAMVNLCAAVAVSPQPRHERFPALWVPREHLMVPSLRCGGCQHKVDHHPCQHEQAVDAAAAHDRQPHVHHNLAQLSLPSPPLPGALPLAPPEARLRCRERRCAAADSCARATCAQHCSRFPVKNTAAPVATTGDAVASTLLAACAAPPARAVGKASPTPRAPAAAAATAPRNGCNSESGTTA